MTLVIGLDLGTTNCKAVALNEQGEVANHASGSQALSSPRPGWAEQDANEVWQSALEALRSLARSLAGDQPAGLCLSGAMHSLLPVGVHDDPLAPAMTWADQRAVPQVERLRRTTDSYAIYRRTGCPLQPVYYPGKLHWWREEAPDIWSRVTRFVALKDWVLFRLTGEWATDISLASTTGLLDIHHADWDEATLELSAVRSDQLPPLVSPRQVVGSLNVESAQLTGLPVGLPIIAGANDGGLANLGSGAYLPGQSVITVGTSGAVRHLLDRPVLDRFERTWCYLLDEGCWFRGGAINNGGLALQWVRQRFYSELPEAEGYERLLVEADSVDAGAAGLLALPYFVGERSPHWNATARAALVGLGFEHTRAHIARAVMEGVAFCLADVWEALAESSPLGVPSRLTGGITRSQLWRQIVADVLGVRLACLEAADASAVGAAMLGLQALGVVDAHSLASRMEPGVIIEPDPERYIFYEKRHTAFQALYQRALSPSTFIH